MILLVLAAAVAIAPDVPQSRAPVAAVAEATATVRIISGVRLNFNSPTNDGAPPPHDSKITTDGNVRSARLIEFE